MNNNNQTSQPSPQKIRQRNFLLVFPVLVLPFITFLLWSVGVIGQKERKLIVKQQSGFKMDLPDAVNTKDSNWNKLQFYEQADKDAASRRKQLRGDPYYKTPAESETADIINTTPGTGRGDREGRYSYDPYPAPSPGKVDPNEEKVYRKLAQLNEELKVQQEKEPPKAEKQEKEKAGVSVNSEDIDRLEGMMQMMQSGNEGEDKEMQEIHGVLEKLLDIQHPERVKDRISAQSLQNKRQVFTVAAAETRAAFTRLDDHRKSMRADTAPVFRLPGRGFYSLEDQLASPVQNNTIRAIIPKTQSLVTGAVVQLQLTSDIVIAGVWIPKDQFIYGTASLNGERLQIVITSIRYGNNILPVELSVFDLDGLEGIYIPGSINRDVAKQSGDQAIQSFGLGSLDPSIAAQATSAGIQAAKTLIGRKAKLVRVNVREGYQVFLKDKKMDK